MPENSIYNLEFLKEFTKELILNSMPAYLREEQNAHREKVKEVIDEIDDEMNKQPLVPTRILRRKVPITPQHHFIPASNIFHRPLKKPIIIDETPLEKEQEFYPDTEGLYLGDLIDPIEDPEVISVECPGPGKHVIVRTRGGSMPSRIILDQEEIDYILNSFSDESRIPRIGGIFKAIVNNLVLTGIDSGITSTKFIITKVHPTKSGFL